MKKTSKQVQGDIYKLLINSTLSSRITGGVYRNGHRPRNSDKEDIVITFTAGLATQIQTGIITIHIFVPDIDPWDDGVFVEDTERIEELQVLAGAWLDDLTAVNTDYLFELQQTITSDEDAERKEHFVVVKLKYKYFDE